MEPDGWCCSIAWVLIFHEFVHKFMKPQEAVTSCNARLLVVVLNVVGLDAFVPNEEGNGFAEVGADFDGCGMIGQNGNADGLIHQSDCLDDGLDEALVEVIDGEKLELKVAIVASLVGGFYVQEDEVVVLQGINGRLRFAFVVGVGKSCGPLHVDDFQAGIMSDAANEVDGRNDAATLDLRILLHEGQHRRSIAAPPRPDAVGQTFTLLGFRQVVRMLGQQFLRLEDEMVQQLCCLPGRESSLFGRRIGFGFYE